MKKLYKKEIEKYIIPDLTNLVLEWCEKGLFCRDLIPYTPILHIEPEEPLQFEGLFHFCRSTHISIIQYHNASMNCISFSS